MLPLQNSFGDIDRVAVDERRAHLDAARGEKRVGHAAADEHPIGEIHQRLERLDFSGDLCTAEERHEGAIGDVGDLLQKFDFVRQKQPACAVIGRIEARKRIDRGVRAMRCAKCIIHVKIGDLPELLRESSIVVLLFGVESKVLQQQELTALELRRHLLRAGPNAVVRPRDVCADEFLELVAHRRE